MTPDLFGNAGVGSLSTDLNNASKAKDEILENEGKLFIR